MAKPRRKYVGINTLVESAADREFLGILAESLGDRKAYEAVEYRPRERMHVFALRGLSGRRRSPPARTSSSR